MLIKQKNFLKSLILKRRLQSFNDLINVNLHDVFNFKIILMNVMQYVNLNFKIKQKINYIMKLKLTKVMKIKLKTKTTIIKLKSSISLKKSRQHMYVSFFDEFKLWKRLLNAH